MSDKNEDSRKLEEGCITEACHGVQLVRSLLANNFEWFGSGQVLDVSEEARRLLDEADDALGRLYQYIGGMNDREEGWVWNGKHWTKPD